MERKKIKVLKKTQGLQALTALEEGFLVTITPVKNGFSIRWLHPILRFTIL
jgi:hypothetical protein